MALEITYCKVWKWIMTDWSLFYNFYGKDFNPNVPQMWFWLTSAWAYSETSNFNLVWFQPWNEVWCCVVIIENNDTSERTQYLSASFQQDWRTTWTYDQWYITVPWNWAWRVYYMYFWIDDDEIWEWVSNYKVIWDMLDDSAEASFTVSNLSIDTKTHKAWYLWIEWTYLCYTDATRWLSWYKHKINYDSYTGWSGEPWYIRVPSWTTWYIYYTDAYGTVRRTHMADERYWWSWYPSWAKEWSIRVSNGDYTQWYGYLCFIDGNGECRRMGNWEP